METEQFNQLVARAVQALPAEFLERLENIDILVADYPSPSQLRKGHVGAGSTLLGLYEGIPQTNRTSGYTMALPDKITIFQRTIEAQCRTENEIVAAVERVVRHEIAHHFGISDDRLRELGKY
ncbi:MAG: metallopeptidase family protein [Dehalococcoidales bacterium]|nr:metallopeptidase family protein [Dehalococcoidales bacterium]